MYRKGSFHKKRTRHAHLQGIEPVACGGFFINKVMTQIGHREDQL